MSLIVRRKANSAGELPITYSLGQTPHRYQWNQVGSFCSSLQISKVPEQYEEHGERERERGDTGKVEMTGRLHQLYFRVIRLLASN